MASALLLQALPFVMWAPLPLSWIFLGNEALCCFKHHKPLRQGCGDEASSLVDPEIGDRQPLSRDVASFSKKSRKSSNVSLLSPSPKPQFSLRYSSKEFVGGSSAGKNISKALSSGRI